MFMNRNLTSSKTNAPRAARTRYSRARFKGVMFTTNNEVKMKESIFRVLSLLIGLGGVFALALDASIILESTIIGGLLFVAVLSSFLLFGLGGSKLIS